MKGTSPSRSSAWQFMHECGKSACQASVRLLYRRGRPEEQVHVCVPTLHHLHEDLHQLQPSITRSIYEQLLGLAAGALCL